MCVLATRQTVAAAAPPAPLVLEAAIVLEHVQGRIDHLAFDPRRERLYVAEYGSDSLGVVDLRARRVVSTIGGLNQPQGVGYLDWKNTIVVANGGDGSVRLLRAADFHAAGVIDLGSDADNVWVDAAGQRFFVGHGDGAIAVIDAANRGKARDIPLRAHPEAFRPSPDGRHLFVNVPDAHEIAVIDLAAVRQTQSWPTPGLGANFPMALSSTGGELWVAFRQPATIAVLSTQTGARLATLDTCADADEVLLDARRSRLYVSCGEGQIDVLEWNAPALRSVARIATRRGARTALFAAETDRLYLAVPASGQQPAAIWVYRPGQQ